MKTTSLRVLSIAATVAILVEAVGLTGWWSWHRAMDKLWESAIGGAEALVSQPLLRLPPVARRARRLPAGLLADAPQELVVSALRSVGDHQVRWAPADPSGFVNRARAELISGDLDTALTSLKAAIFRNPMSPELHRLAGIAARAGGRNEVALDHLATSAGLGSGGWRRRVELTPEEADWIVMEGLRRKLDVYPRARTRNVIALAKELRKRDFEEEGRLVLEEETRDPRVVIELARWDVGAGSFATAESRLADLTSRRTLTSAILADAWAVTAMARDRGGDPDGAVAAAEMALSYNPRSVAPYRVLAQQAERRGEPGAALNHLRRAWGMNPTDVNLLREVARTAERAEVYDDAKLALERAVKVAPDDPRLRADLVDYQLRRGDFMAATVALSEALDRFPTDPKLLRLAERLRSEVARR